PCRLHGRTTGRRMGRNNRPAPAGPPMPTRAACPNPGCRRSYTLADGLATPHARCPACRTALTYPDAPAAAPETVGPPATGHEPPLSLDSDPVAPTEAGP